MAKPIVTEMMDLGKDIMNRDVKKMLTIIERPKSQYFFAYFKRVFTSQILKKVSKNNWKGQQGYSNWCVDYRVSIAITAGGRPIPRKSLL